MSRCCHSYFFGVQERKRKRNLDLIPFVTGASLFPRPRWHDRGFVDDAMTGEERIPNKGKGKYPLPPPPPRLPDSPPNKRLKLIPAQGVRPRGPQHDKDGGGSSSSTSRGKGKGRGESSVASKSFKRERNTFFILLPASKD